MSDARFDLEGWARRKRRSPRFPPVRAGAILLLTGLGSLLAGPSLLTAQPAASPRPGITEAFNGPLQEAQRRQDETAVRRLAAEARAALGSSAGIPEIPDDFRAVPAEARGLTAAEAVHAFQPYVREIQRRKWWRIGEDPTRAEHALRDTASVTVGCLAAARAGCVGKESLVALARDAGDYLVWAQEQGGTGVFPFPASHAGRGKEFEVADHVLRRAEQTGRLREITRNGWIIEDGGFNPGGLEFDNGLCGAALFELWEATGDERYLRSARGAADWAARRPAVPNWNYNSFSVLLLAMAYRVTHEEKYRREALQKARLGIYPGQIPDGPREGRWYDPHNASVAYHFVLVRGLIVLASILDERGPDRVVAVTALKRALKARNVDFRKRGISNIDSALEALSLLEKCFPSSSAQFGDCGQDEALEALGRSVGATFRSGRPPCSPAVWGRYLEYVVRSAPK